MLLRLSILTLFVVALAGCQQETAEVVQDTPEGIETPPPVTTGSAVGTVDPGGVADPRQEVSLIEYSIRMPQTLAAGEHTFAIHNNGKELHSFEIEGNGVHASLPSPMSRGSTATLELKLTPGMYTVYCPVEGHREKGMETKVIVR